MGFQLLLMVLVNAEFCELELALLVLAQQGHLLRLSFELGFVLLYECVFILLEFNLALFIKSVFFLPDELLLLFLVLADRALRLNFKLLLVILNLVTE